MSDEHDHTHTHEPAAPGHAAPPDDGGAPIEDGGSQALAEALKSSFRILKVVMIILAVCLPFSNWFEVRPQQKAVILRFGKPVGTGSAALLGSGPHWAFPYPIDKVEIIPYSESLTMTSTVGGNIDVIQTNKNIPLRPTLNPAFENYVITGDGNIIQSRATVSYRVADPIRYHFDFTNAPELMQEAVDNALVETAGRFKVDDILTVNTAGFKEAVQNRIEALVKAENLGVAIENCQVQSRPPLQLADAFDKVLSAESWRAQTNLAAIRYSNDVVFRALATASGLTNQAYSEMVRLVESVKADADSFLTNLPAYKQNPAIYTQLILAEERAKALTNARAVWYIPRTLKQIRIGVGPEIAPLNLKPVATSPGNIYN